MGEDRRSSAYKLGGIFCRILILMEVISILVCMAACGVKNTDYAELDSGQEESESTAGTEQNDSLEGEAVFNNKNNFLVKKVSTGIFVLAQNDDEAGIYFKKNGAAKWQKCYEGNVVLGAVYRDYLYYLVADLQENKVSIARISAATLETESIFEHCGELYLDNSAICFPYLFVFHGNDLKSGLVFELAQDGTVKASEGVPFEDYFGGQLKEGEYRISSDYSRIYCVSDGEQGKEIYYFEPIKGTYRYLNKIGEIELMTESRIFFSENGSLYAMDGDSGAISRLCGFTEQDYLFTHDQEYIYGVFQNEDLNTCMKLTLQGEKQKLFDFENVDAVPRLALSVLEKNVYYYDYREHRVVCVDLESGTKENIGE